VYIYQHQFLAFEMSMSIFRASDKPFDRRQVYDYDSCVSRTHIKQVLMMLVVWWLFGISVVTHADQKTIRLVTSTTTSDSGLLEVLLPNFEVTTGYTVKLFSVGSGTALRMGRNGQADVLLVHAPEEEKQFIADGFGLNRHAVMQNIFCIVGPEHDPAGIRGISDPHKAMQRIAATRSLFISRGDDSGTHKKEAFLWQGSSVDPIGMPWYWETGKGMGDTLATASELQAYTLTDAGTWLARKDLLALTMVLKDSPLLDNPYHAIAVNQDKHPDINHDGANAFIHWISSPEAQQLIDQFRFNGKVLFLPVQQH